MSKTRTSKKYAERERIIIRVVFMAAVAWLAFYGCGIAAADYSFYLDMFDVSGQINASEEFDDGVVAPWVIFDPTVEEADGFVSFSSPGTIESGVLDGLNYEAEMSFIGSGYSLPFVVFNGSGNFTSLSRWDAIVPGVNQWYAMDVGYEVQQEPHIGIDIGVGVANWDSDFAAIMGIEPGLGISFRRSSDDYLLRHILVSEDEFTSAETILLRLDFDDDTDEFKAGFSLDNGDTYQYFPEPLGWGQDTPGHYEWYFSGQAIILLSDPIEVILDFVDEAVEDGTLTGVGPGASGDKRLNALRNMLENVNALIEDGFYEEACNELWAAYRKCDGDPSPPDFVTGESAGDLADMILILMEELGCGL